MQLSLLILLPLASSLQEMPSAPSLSDFQPDDHLEAAGSSPDDLQKVNQQMEFMTNVACYLLLQRRLAVEESTVQALQKDPQGQVAVKKIVANLFKICKEEVPQDLKIRAISAKSKEEMDEIELGPLEYFDLAGIASSPPTSLTSEEQKIFKFVENVETEIRKLRKKNGQDPDAADPESPDSQYDDLDDSDDGYADTSQQKTTSIAGFDINDINGLWLVGPALLLVFGGVFFFWYKLFLREPKIKKTKKKN